METVEHKVTIPIYVKRCGVCRRYFGTEDNAYWNCAGCANDKHEEALEKIRHLERVVSGLRSALSRWSKRRKKSVGA